tara:strand:- start:75 stop:566 length:492 start_codon:yes stop_codon:yes gene_type:complete
MFLLDASVLITAHNTYYALERVPEYWAWLRHHGNNGDIAIPEEIYAEIEGGNDLLADWMSEEDSKDCLKMAEEADPDHLTHILGVYGNALSEDDLIKIGKDPFLVAAGFADKQQRIVVTAEVSKPGREGANRHIPNICEDCGVNWINPIEFLQQLNFTTDWNP